MNTLFAKLSTALLLIVGLMGTAFFVVERINTRLYYEELTQRLNAPIAMYVTGQRQLIDNGVPDLDGLGELASHAMVINPTAEIYLLDTDGNILGHVLPEDTTTRAAAQAARCFLQPRSDQATSCKVTSTSCSAGRLMKPWQTTSVVHTSGR
jgi:hypothetical protein